MVRLLKAIAERPLGPSAAQYAFLLAVICGLLVMAGAGLISTARHFLGIGNSGTAGEPAALDAFGTPQ